MLRVKKNDMVVVIAGKDKGKKGKVLRMLPAGDRAIVENVNVVKKARRRTRQDEQGGIIKIEASIHISNLMLVDKGSNQPTRVGMKILKDGSRVRVSKKSGAVI